MELRKLQGDWRISALETDGQAMADAQFQGARLRIKGDTFVSAMPDATYRGKVRMLAARSPKAMDLIFTDGPAAGTTSEAIYRLDGDTWTLCLGLPGVARPTEFKSRPGSGHVLEMLKRDPEPDTKRAIGATAPEPGKQAPAAPIVAGRAAQGALNGLSGNWRMLAGTRGGVPIPDALVRSARRSAHGDRIRISFGGSVVLDASINVLQAQGPMAVDYLLLSGPHKGQTQHGICELRAGILRSCFAPPGSARPTSFQSTCSGRETLTAWQRI